MNLGKQIKLFRLKISMTQEKLAQKLGVTPQAVCKWENGNSMPDIALLPELSALFGITIDELFGLNEAVHIQRIDNMLRNETEIKDSDFKYAEDFLNSCIYTKEIAERLAKLYNAEADMYRRKAKCHAEKGTNHSVLCEASKGVVWDWCETNHHELIDFYYEYIKNNREDSEAYVRLMENLTADMRLDEAENVLKKYEVFGKTCRYYRIKADILFRRGRCNEAERCYAAMIEKYPEDWKAVSYYADFCAGNAQYDKALTLYEQSIELQTAPRLLDNYICIAHIYEIKREYSKAIDVYNKIIDVLTDEHGYDVNGAVVFKYKKKIELLQDRCSA